VFIARTTGNEVSDATRRGWDVTALAPASFDVERFERADDACIEVRGRWSGVRGRRFMRPTLTAVAGGREQRILAVLDHKPWIAEDGEIWRAAFPCETDPASLRDAELTVAPGVTVPLAPPSAGPRSRSPRTAAPERSTTAEAEDSSQLERLERQCERLRAERDQALAAHDGALAERHDVIEAEVAARMADLRGEAERDRAGARLAAQSARERDGARADRDGATRERDAARAERDSAVQARNRMLAERDTAQTRVEEVARQWELTAGLGTRRTLERDMAANERDTVAGERDRLARDRDNALEERDRVARDLDAALEERDRTAEERAAALAELDSAASEDTAAFNQAEATIVLEQDETTIVLEQAEATSEWRESLVASEHELASHELGLPLGDGEESGVWRARVLAVSALLVALIVLLVLTLAK
jgi:hypothetical protein